MKISLTDLGVQRLKPGTYFDTKTVAFGIRVGAHSRTWIITKGQHPRRTITLGRYPDVSLQEARRKAFAAFIAPDVHVAKITFLEAKTEFLAQQGRWRAQSLQVLKGTLKRFDWQGQLAKVTHNQVVEKLQAIPGRSARAHALRNIRTFFNWCVPRYLSSSPADHIRMERQPSRDRVLSADELKAVWLACDDVGAFGAIVRLLILTGQRRTEIGSLRWSWITRDRFVWPGSATKNGREHSIPMGPLAWAVLAKRPRHGQYVFPARCRVPDVEPRPFVGWSESLARLQTLSETQDWTLHDLRRTFATDLARIGTPIHVTEKILNHVSGVLSGVAGIYNRFDYWEEQAEVLRRREEQIRELCY